MHIPSRVACGLAAAAVVAGAAQPTGARAARAPGGFELTVDSIMRGPKLVGYPPTGLRWSGDSSRLYFEWRRPGDDEASTWVVPRDGGEPKKLSDADRRSAPPVVGAWDKAHRRVLFVDQGDIVLLDSVSGVRRNVTRTTGNEVEPAMGAPRKRGQLRRARTTCSSCRSTAARSSQLTDVQPRKRDPRETDSQKFVKDEEQKLIEHTRVQAEKKKKTEDKDKARALPKLELADRQTATDLQLSPDGTHVFVLIVERTETAKRTNVPNYVTESSYTEDIPARTFVGDAQDKRTLAIMNLETGKTSQADAGFAGTVPLKPAQDGKTQPRAVRWGMPQISDDGARAVAHVRADDNKDRWLVVVDPESGKSRVLDTLHDDAWVREVGGFGPNDPSFGWQADQTHVWFLSERDRWMHLYSVDATADRPDAAAADRREVGDRVGQSVARQAEVLHHQHRGPPRRATYLRDGRGRRRAHEADVDDRRKRRRSLARRQHVRD